MNIIACRGRRAALPSGEDGRGQWNVAEWTSAPRRPPRPGPGRPRTSCGRAGDYGSTPGTNAHPARLAERLGWTTKSPGRFLSSTKGKKLTHRPFATWPSPKGFPLRLDRSPPAVDPPAACEPSDALWLEVKVAYQFAGRRPPRRYGAHGASTSSTTCAKGADALIHDAAWCSWCQRVAGDPRQGPRAVRGRAGAQGMLAGFRHAERAHRRTDRPPPGTVASGPPPAKVFSTCAWAPHACSPKTAKDRRGAVYVWNPSPRPSRTARNGRLP